ncbi:TIGR00730 family Rossman fold protein [Gordonia sp. (in: high G+C Gram-positive bacteria)]|uniref:LOG family protein n=1 Tax=Gordonia sp. (in: high G+C Gram-positive bacteria) TaxID=84139 RepID=UPI0039E582EC
MSAICVYCASGPVPQRHVDLARDLGTALGEAGHTLVSGGGNVSMMGAVAAATRAAGGKTIGIIPGHLVDREAADHNSDELIVTDTMRERKRLMEVRADGFITLPGGIGTLEELFETWTGGFLGEHDKPVVLLDADGFYQPLLRWLADLRGEGFVADAALEKLQVATSIPDAVTRVTRQ